MRTPQQLASIGVIAAAWGTVAISVANTWDEHLHDAIIGAAICITIAIVAVSNRSVYHRDLDILRTEVDTAIKASNFGQVLDKCGTPFRPAVPDGPVRSVPITGENAIAGVRDGTLIDLNAVRDAIRRSES
ncbi:hypothetical protein NE236_41605 [Actinoallomurus purpureus]|uniref:hypothetical protein n=1 Tax=Actinoallomurus purpureus TaxID=478114 RepID=UPI002092AB23|nr:hypothetical protein [Actinoallomurus purpureus]MCO6011466.1 hypothetical protein [Actinoallomurus purpureus]